MALNMTALPGHEVRAIEDPTDLCCGTRDAKDTLSHPSVARGIPQSRTARQGTPKGIAELRDCPLTSRLYCFRDQVR